MKILIESTTRWTPVKIVEGLMTYWVLIKGLKVYGPADPDRIYCFTTKRSANIAANKLNQS